MKPFKLLVGVSYVIGSIFGVRYIKEKIDDQRRLWAFTIHEPASSRTTPVKSEASDSKVIKPEAGPPHF